MIYEPALRTMVGGREVMKRQLRHLLTAGEPRNVTIQVLPTDSGTVLALTGSLVLLETNEHEFYAYTEAPEASVLSSDAETLSRLTQCHGMIRTQALNAKDSARFIAKVEEEL